MKPLSHDPCVIHLRWYDANPPEVGHWLISKRTAYHVISARHVAAKAMGWRQGDADVRTTCIKLRIGAIRHVISDVPANAVRHAFTWDHRGKKR